MATVMLLASGCNKGGVDPKYNFITLHHKMDAMNNGQNVSTVSQQDGYVTVGNTRAEVKAVVGGGNSLDSGVWGKYEKSADGVADNDVLISMMVDQANKTTMYGTSLNSNYADLIPAYAKDKDVVVELDSKEKVIFSKVIDGVKYTVTYRNYPSSGDVKTITITNTAKYTESDDDYPQYQAQ